MKIALVQQRASSDPAKNLKRGMESLRRAAEQGGELVVYPELAFLPFLPQKPAAPESLALAEPIPGPTTEAFAKLARQLGVTLVLNLFERDGERTYDASPVIGPDGNLLGVTRMLHIMDGPGFLERDYYSPGGSPSVYDTPAGRVGVAICYDRHFPEYLRSLALQDAELVVIPQAGTVDEWGPGMFEAEIRAAAFQNGFFAALANRVGREEVNNFAGESFVVDPAGEVLARAPRGEEVLLFAELDLNEVLSSPARRHFLQDRNPEAYKKFGLSD
jgi:beta-ureidopropionase